MLDVVLALENPHGLVDRDTTLDDRGVRRCGENPPALEKLDYSYRYVSHERSEERAGAVEVTTDVVVVATPVDGETWAMEGRWVHLLVPDEDGGYRILRQKVLWERPKEG